ncbi:MAG: DUF6508 domain-containing protein [Cecembia sp.]
MHSVFTSLDSIASYLNGESGKKAIKDLGAYIKKIEQEMQRVKNAFPLTLTEESRMHFIDLDDIKTDLKKTLLASGLMVDYDGEEWIEGQEMLEGLRPMGKLSPIKACKLLSRIMIKDASDFGYYEQQLKNGTLLKIFRAIVQDGENEKDQ